MFPGNTKCPLRDIGLWMLQFSFQLNKKYESWHLQLFETLKVKFWHFWHLFTNSQNSIISHGYVDFKAKIFPILYTPLENSTTRIAIISGQEILPDGMMCTNVSMWSDVYWTPENVSVCSCEIETKKIVEIKQVCTSFFDNYQKICPIYSI